MSARLILNLTDHVYHSDEPREADARSLLTRMLMVLIRKFDSLRAYVPIVLARERRRAVRRAWRQVLEQRRLRRMLKWAGGKSGSGEDSSKPTTGA